MGTPPFNKIKDQDDLSSSIIFKASNEKDKHTMKISNLKSHGSNKNFLTNSKLHFSVGLG